MEATVIGAGLAGCEAAWQLAQRGVAVKLIEWKPRGMSPAHHSGEFAELVCSNSLRSDQLSNAAGLLKEEMRRLGSLIIRCADETRVPAGGALAVDREGFSALVTQTIRTHKKITVAEEEALHVPRGVPVIVATGPLTADALAEDIARITGSGYLHFYDAAAPLIDAESINMRHAFFAARYGKGTPDYINCPMDKQQYEAFHSALIGAQTAALKEFERDMKVFEGCMPVEVMAKRGRETLLFGPLKPVGLTNPQTGEGGYYAVVQLRRDNSAATLYNMVGFQTNLKFEEQRRVFRMIPALCDAEFVRYGVMHRNTFINSPALLDDTYRLRKDENIYFAGQISGVEGYVESAASGLWAGLNLARRLRGRAALRPSKQTAVGALACYISNAGVGELQPMNVNFGIMEGLSTRIRSKKERNEAVAARALDVIGQMKEELD